MSYLVSPEVVIAYNRKVLIRNEPHGLKHGGQDLLESALGRPVATFSGAAFFPRVEDRAGSLFHSLAVNHPFLDGNKRTATMAAYLYLEASGFRVSCSGQDFVEYASQMVAEDHDVHQVIEWVVGNTYAM